MYMFHGCLCTQYNANIDQIHMISNVAMANSIGPKAAAKQLATAQGSIAMNKMLNDEPVLLIEVVKAYYTDGPNVHNGNNANEVLKLVQEEKIPLHNSLFYDLIDYVDKKLSEKKTYCGQLYDAQKHTLSASDVDAILQAMAKCEAHHKDLIAIKELIKYHDQKYTRESIKNWFGELIRHEWPTFSMNENCDKYNRYLFDKPNYITTPSSNPRPTPKSRPRKRNTTKTPKSTKTGNTTKKPKKKRQPRTSASNAQDINLDIFEEYCWYHNWRDNKCNRGENCDFGHLCSIEGCASTTHRAADHHKAMKQ